MYDIVPKNYFLTFISILILIIFLPSTFFIEAINIDKIYGQESKDIESKDISKPGSDKWQTFSNSKFSIMYPDNWILKDKISRFHELDLNLLKITEDSFPSFLGISFDVIQNPDKLSNELVLDQSEEVGKFSSKSVYEVYDILERNLTKYKIDDNNSASHIIKYTYKDNQLEGKLLEVFSVIDNKLFILTYQSAMKDFDKDLPIVDKIIKSIKISK